MLVVIDANVVSEALINVTSFLKIITTKHVLKAPPKLLNEVISAKWIILRDNKISSTKFDKRLAAIMGRIIFEEPNEEELYETQKIILSLKLDITDLEYLALCFRYKKLKPTFWTFDTLFVIGNAAQRLRKEFNLFGNFNI